MSPRPLGWRAGCPLTLALCLPLLAGCAKTPRDKLQGRWLGESIDNVPAAEVVKATGWVKGTALEFSGNKVTVTIPAESPRTGTFKVAKVEGEKVVVAFQRPEGGRDEATFRFHGDSALVWEAGEGRDVLLLKAKN